MPLRVRYLVVGIVVLDLMFLAGLYLTQRDDDGCDVSARGLVVWTDNHGQMGVPRGQWVTLERAPKGADLPPCRLGTKPDPRGFRPV